MARAVGGSAAAGRRQLFLGVGNADQQHAVMQQRQHHRQQRGLLASVQRRGGGEHRRRLSRQGARQPLRRGAVEKVLQRRRHVAETGRTAERKRRARVEIGVRRVGRPLCRHRVIAGFAHGGYPRNGAHARLHAVDLLDAPGDEARHACDVAVQAVVKDQHLRHD